MKLPVKKTKLALLILALFFVVYASPTAVSAQQEEYHPLKFYLHTNLAAGFTTEELNGRLALYAADLNMIFAQTNRRFLFDPATDIIITNTQPHTSVGGSFPTTGYEIWVYAQLSDWTVDNHLRTYGGSASFDGPSGAGVATDLRWDTVHDRSTLVDGSRDMEEYWLQIDHIVHELSHVFGAGISEYYGLAQVNDVTGVPPTQHINSLAADDPYWIEHPDYFTDPLLWNIWNRSSVGSPTGYAELMGTVHLAEVTVAVINDPCRLGNTGSCLQNTLPDLSNTKVHVVDALTGKPISGAQVMVWNVRSASPYSPTLITDTSSDAAGEITFAWDTVTPVVWFSNYHHLKLIKAFASNYQSAVQYVSIFDAQERKMVHGLNEMVVTLYMWPDTVYAAPDMTTCGSWTPCYSGNASIQEALNAIPDGGRVVVLGNHETTNSLQSSNNGANRAAIDGRYGGAITWSGGAGALFAVGSGPLSVTGLSLQCQSNCTDSIVFNQTGGELLAYANNITGFGLGYAGSGAANLRHNWWGTSADASSIGQSDAFVYRLGASIVNWELLTLGEARMRSLSGEGVGVLVTHGRGEAQAPFGAATSIDGGSQCSDYYDFFTVNGGGDWLVETPIDTSPTGCLAVHDNGQIFGFALTAGGAPDTSCTGSACWQIFEQAVSLAHPHSLRLRLNASQLLGTPIVAANDAGNDPTAVSLTSLRAARGSSAFLGAFLAALLLAGMCFQSLIRLRSHS